MRFHIFVLLTSRRRQKRRCLLKMRKIELSFWTYDRRQQIRLNLLFDTVAGKWLAIYNEILIIFKKTVQNFWISSIEFQGPISPKKNSTEYIQFEFFPNFQFHQINSKKIHLNNFRSRKTIQAENWIFSLEYFWSNWPQNKDIWRVNFFQMVSQQTYSTFVASCTVDLTAVFLALCSMSTKIYSNFQLMCEEHCSSVFFFELRHSIWMIQLKTHENNIHLNHFNSIENKANGT